MSGARRYVPRNRGIFHRLGIQTLVFVFAQMRLGGERGINRIDLGHVCLLLTGSPGAHTVETARHLRCGRQPSTFECSVWVAKPPNMQCNIMPAGACWYRVNDASARPANQAV